MAGIKKCTCSAVVSDDVKRCNLCECVQMLGGHPVECGDKVSVVYAGEKAETMALLFRQYKDSSIWEWGDGDV